MIRDSGGELWKINEKNTCLEINVETLKMKEKNKYKKVLKYIFF